MAVIAWWCKASRLRTCKDRPGNCKQSWCTEILASWKWQLYQHSKLRTTNTFEWVVCLWAWQMSKWTQFSRSWRGAQTYKLQTQCFVGAIAAKSTFKKLLSAESLSTRKWRLKVILVWKRMSLGTTKVLQQSNKRWAFADLMETCWMDQL